MMLYNCGGEAELLGYLKLLYDMLAKTPVNLSGQESRLIGASFGFAWTMDYKEDIIELIAHADEALYEAKRDGKGTYRKYRG